MIAVCIGLVLVGLVTVVCWGGLTVEPPPMPAPGPAGPTDPAPVRLVVRRLLWSLTIAVTSGVGAGILAAGVGGRLVMRLLAVTAGTDAQGHITEAEQIVGRTTIGGTLSFIIFTALFLGLPSGAAYLLLRRWLPAGWAGGLAYGALLLVVAGSRVEPVGCRYSDRALELGKFVSTSACYRSASPAPSAEATRCCHDSPT